MKVVRLGERYTTSYLPDRLIEGYSSMIWTERFQQPGDFELTTPLIDETAELLPEDTLISHLETGDVHIVETHETTTDEEGDEQLVIRGRSLELMMDHRHVESAYNKKRKMRRSYTPVNAVGTLLWNAFDNNSGKDVTRGDTDPDTELILNDYSWNTKDRITNILITDSVGVDGESNRRWLVEGSLGPQLMDILIKEDLAVRMIRPGQPPFTQIITVTVSPLADRGTVVKSTLAEGYTAMRFDIYKGLDRSASQSTNPRVKFSLMRGDLSDPKWLSSNADLKTGLEVISSVGGADIYRSTADGNLSGIQRRIMSYDFGEPDIPPEPVKPAELRKNATKAEREDRADAMDVWIDKHANWVNRKNNIIDEFKEDNDKIGLRELKKKRKVSQFTGEISPDTDYVFKTDYNLGDTVSLYDRHGKVQDMVVTEYIRTEDEDGDKQYPGLILP